MFTDEFEEHEHRVSIYHLHHVISTETGTEWSDGQFLLLLTSFMLSLIATCWFCIDNTI